MEAHYDPGALPQSRQAVSRRRFVNVPY
jgi:hypothetical protein